MHVCRSRLQQPWWREVFDWRLVTVARNTLQLNFRGLRMHACIQSLAASLGVRLDPDESWSKPMDRSLLPQVGGADCHIKGARSVNVGRWVFGHNDGEEAILTGGGDVVQVGVGRQVELAHEFAGAALHPHILHLPIRHRILSLPLAANLEHIVVLHLHLMSHSPSTYIYFFRFRNGHPPQVPCGKHHNNHHPGGDSFAIMGGYFQRDCEVMYYMFMGCFTYLMIVFGIYLYYFQTGVSMLNSF